METNEKESRRCAFEFLDMNYVEVDEGLKRNEFNNFCEYELKVREFKEYYEAEAPDGP